MALINCPECGKEISDKSNVCINCGFPISENKKIIKQEIYHEKIKESKNNKKILVQIFIIILLISIVFFVFKLISNNKYNDYLDIVRDAKTEMYFGASEAEKTSNLIKNIWFDAIYEEYDTETYMYTRPNGQWVDDFNEALNNYFSSQSYKTSIGKINKSNNDVAELMKELQNPPKDLDDIYDSLTDLYGLYINVCNNAIDPSGSLTTYSQTTNDLISDYISLNNKLEAKIPEKNR